MSNQAPAAVRCNPRAYVPRRATEDVLRSLSSLVRGGEPAIVVLHGPSGIGKSMLMKVLAERLSSTCSVAYAGAASENGFLYPLLELLGTAVNGDPVEALKTAAARAAEAKQSLLLLLDHAEVASSESTRQLVNAAKLASPRPTLIFAVCDGHGAEAFIRVLEKQSQIVLLPFDQVMNEQEARAYLRLRLRLAGVEFSNHLASHLDPASPDWILQESNRLPSELNRRILGILKQYEGEEVPEPAEPDARDPFAPAQVVHDVPVESEPVSPKVGDATFSEPGRPRPAPATGSTSLGGALLGRGTGERPGFSIQRDFELSLGAGLLESKFGPPAPGQVPSPACETAPTETTLSIPHREAPSTNEEVAEPMPRAVSLAAGVSRAVADPKAPLDAESEDRRASAWLAAGVIFAAVLAGGVIASQIRSVKPQPAMPLTIVPAPFPTTQLTLLRDTELKPDITAEVPEPFAAVEAVAMQNTAEEAATELVTVEVAAEDPPQPILSGETGLEIDLAPVATSERIRSAKEWSEVEPGSSLANRAIVALSTPAPASPIPNNEFAFALKAELIQAESSPLSIAEATAPEPTSILDFAQPNEESDPSLEIETDPLPPISIVIRPNPTLTGGKAMVAGPYARLKIQSQADLKLSIDGQAIGTAPFPDIYLAPGDHRFVSETPDGIVIDRLIDIVADSQVLDF